MARRRHSAVDSAQFALRLEDWPEIGSLWRHRTRRFTVEVGAIGAPYIVFKQPGQTIEHQLTCHFDRFKTDFEEI